MVFFGRKRRKWEFSHNTTKMFSRKLSEIPRCQQSSSMKTFVKWQNNFLETLLQCCKRNPIFYVFNQKVLFHENFLDSFKTYHFFYISEKKVTKHFVTYKILTALFFLVILVLTLVMLYIKTEWFKFYFIYATNWTFILMTFGAILEAILVIVRYRGEKNISNWQFVGTISIWISSMTYAGEMLITFCYWTAIHDWTSTNTKYNDAAFYFNLTHHLAPVSLHSVEIS